MGDELKMVQNTNLLTIQLKNLHKNGNNNYYLIQFYNN